MSVRSKIDVYPLENYIVSSGVDLAGGSLGVSTKAEERRCKTPLEKLVTLKSRCHEEQTVQSVEGVCLVHLHRHPHVLLLKQTLKRNKDAAGNRLVPPTHLNVDVSYRLPGGRCRRGEGEETCLRRKLGHHLLNEPKAPNAATTLALPSSATATAAAAGGGVNGSASLHSDPVAESDTILDVGLASGLGQASSTFFRVGDLLGRWYRPHFSPLMYPYVPPHIPLASVKEVRSVFLVHMEPILYLTMTASNVELVAVPLFDLYDNAAKYGPILASLPAVLSRVLINYCNTEY